MRPWALTSPSSAWKLCWTSGSRPGDRLVQDQQLGLVHERLDQAELLPVAGRQLAYGAIEIGVEALDQRVTDARIDPAPQLREVVEHGPSRQLRIQREIAGQKADPAADLEAVVDACPARAPAPSPRSA